MDKIKGFRFKRKHLKILLISILIFIVLIFSFFANATLYILKKGPETKLDNLYSSFNQTSSIFNKEGNLLEEVESLEFRTIVPIDKIPKDLINAFISIEDQRFYQHNGVDPQGILGSIFTNIKSQRIVRGGSTITQQLVKNVYLSDEQSYIRKINEAYLALRVENNLSKEEILEAYLNRINLGQGAYGVQGAAQTYFSKNVSELTLAQSALLAGIVKSPTQYQPFLRIPKEEFKGDEKDIFSELLVNGQEMYLLLNPKSFDRQKIVLNKMKQLNYIDDKDYEIALNEDVVSEFKPLIKKQHSMSSYSMDLIKEDTTKELAKYYNISLEEAEHKLFTGGYSIYTSIDEKLQNNIENIYEDFIDFINSETNSRKGAKMLSFEKDDYNNIIDENGKVIYYNIGNVFDENENLILSEDNYSFLNNGDLQIRENPIITKDEELFINDCYSINENNNLITYTPGKLNIPKESYSFQDGNIIIKKQFLKENDSFLSKLPQGIIIYKDYFEQGLIPTLQPQSSTVVMDNKGGFIKAIIGGLDLSAKNSKIFNRVTDSKRQPGSVLTPFSVYLPSLENGYTIGSITDDIPFKYDGQWWPQNFYRGHKGLMTSRFAIEYNSSVVPVKILDKIGFDKALDFLSKVKIFNSKDPKNDSIVSFDENQERNDFTMDALALGNLVKGVSNMELTSSYMSIANDGKFIEPTSVIQIKDSSGITIVDNTNREFQDIFSLENAFLMKDILRTNTTMGNTKGSKVKGMVTSSMLGVNKFNSDLWVMGFTPHYTVGTWIGCDIPKITLNSDNDTVIRLWNNIAQAANDDEEKIEEYTIPENMIKKYICHKSGKLASKNCEYSNDAYLEYFISGTEPTDYCTQHKFLKICNSSNLLATKYCPQDTVEYKGFFERIPSYNPKDFDNKYPDDYQYIPKKHCHIHTKEWFDLMKEKEEEERLKELQKKKTTTKSRSSSNENTKKSKTSKSSSKSSKKN